MILDNYRQFNNFSFEDYFNSVNSYIHAQAYWTEVLRAVPGYSPDDWTPIPETRSLADDMLDGRMLWLDARDGTKQIMVHMTSVDGAAQLLVTDNSGLDARAEADLRALFGDDFPVDDSLRQPLSLAAARAIAQTDLAAHPTRIWVETRAPWSPHDPAVERLSLTSVISEDAEKRALHALALFVGSGPAAIRVNRIFAPEAL